MRRSGSSSPSSENSSRTVSLRNWERNSNTQAHSRHLYDPGEVNCAILVTLRSDYVYLLDKEQLLIPSFMKNRMELLGLNGESAMEAVLNPGEGIITEQTAELIARKVSNEKQIGLTPLADLVLEPSLLSLVCQRLDHDRQSHRRAQIEAENVPDSLAEILNEFYHGCFEGLDQRARLFVENELVSPSGFRDNRFEDDGISQMGAEALQHLIDERLLHAEERSGRRRVELCHDVLLEPLLLSKAQRQENESAARAEEERRVADLKRKEAEEREREALRLQAEAEHGRGEAERQRDRARRNRNFMCASLVVACLGIAAAVIAALESHKTNIKLNDQNLALESTKGKLERNEQELANWQTKLGEMLAEKQAELDDLERDAAVDQRAAQVRVREMERLIETFETQINERNRKIAALSQEEPPEPQKLLAVVRSELDQAYSTLLRDPDAPGTIAWVAEATRQAWLEAISEQGMAENLSFEVQTSPESPNSFTTRAIVKIIFPLAPDGPCARSARWWMPDDDRLLWRLGRWSSGRRSECSTTGTTRSS